jgi:gamma-glutamyltranspeptidase/glutathione hydrolase
MYPTPRSHRPLIMGRNGAVGANHPLAAQAGLDILRAGGNAVDAAVATSLALGVVEPMMSGLGGDGFYHVLVGGKRVCFNGTGPAPKGATAERYAGGIPTRGGLSASVPGCLAGIAMMHARHGRMPWAALAGPAIGHAREGFGATHGFRHFAHDARGFLAPDARSAAVFLGKELGGLVVQEDLARTLEQIAAEGAETFYRGALAKRLAKGLAEAGSLIGEADLAECFGEEQAPIGIRYRDWEITQTGPNSTGFTMLQIMKIAERFDFAALSPADRVHVLVEAKKLAFVDRETYGADPRFETVPLEMLLSDAHADALAARIDMGRAAVMSQRVAQAAEGNTTYFCVVDKEGNAVSGIQSINGAFGSGVTAGDTGVLMNNRMAYWHLAPGHANRLMPGKRVRHTMNAPMVFRDGKLEAVLGTPGADNQVQVNAQVATAMLDLGCDPQTAIEMPRWTSSQPGQGANWPHEGDQGLTIEADFGAELLSQLARRGHEVKPVGHIEGPCAMQVIRVLGNGVRMAGSDTRRDGWAGAY